MKKKSVIILCVVLGLIIIIAGAFISTKNSFVEKNENVENKLSAISTQLQRRADLIPNFVSSVKGYSDYEKSTYTDVTNARSAVNSASSVKEKQDAANQLDSAVSVWVNAVTEAYPDLKANAQYIALMDELAGTENRISTARKDYNDATKEYNVAISRFPASIVASVFGYTKADYFSADDSASSVPQVSFD